jgi:hypothetical protein
MWPVAVPRTTLGRFGGVLVLAAVIMAIALAGTAVCVVDALRQPAAAWDAAEQSRSTWIAVMCVLPVAFVAYWGSIRPQLRRALQVP